MKNSWDYIIDKLGDFEFKPGITSFVNPYSMLVLKQYPDICEAIDYWYIDGISLLNKINSYKKSAYARISFDDTSLAPIIFQLVKQNTLSVAIIGTEEQYIHKAISSISAKYNIEVNFCRNGYFIDSEERRNVLHTIYNEKFDIVICGMGTPYQEQFLIDLKNLGWNGYGFTCGGYLHQMAQNSSYYPNWINKYNLRWLYRMYDEPKLIKRYLIKYPRFFISFKKYLNRKK